MGIAGQGVCGPPLLVVDGLLAEVVNLHVGGRALVVPGVAEMALCVRRFSVSIAGVSVSLPLIIVCVVGGLGVARLGVGGPSRVVGLRLPLSMRVVWRVMRGLLVGAGVVGVFLRGPLVPVAVVRLEVRW